MKIKDGKLIETEQANNESIINSEIRRFTRKNIIYYFLTNIFFNWCIPYFSFDDLKAVYLLQGENPIVRFLLPMSLLLPAIVTLDVLKKAFTLSEKGRLNFILPANISKNGFMIKLALINGVGTLLIISLLTLGLYAILPKHYSFDGTFISISMGIMAGIMAVIFTLQPLNEVKKLKAVD